MQIFEHSIARRQPKAKWFHIQANLFYVPIELFMMAETIVIYQKREKFDSLEKAQMTWVINYSVSFRSESKMFQPRLNNRNIHFHKRDRIRNRVDLQDKPKKFNSLFNENANEYFENSTIHGLRYVSDSSLSIIERFVQWRIKANEFKCWFCSLIEDCFSLQWSSL